MIGQVHGEDAEQSQTTAHVEQLDAFGRGDGRDRGAIGGGGATGSDMRT